MSNINLKKGDLVVVKTGKTGYTATYCQKITGQYNRHYVSIGGMLKPVDGINIFKK